MSGNGHWTARRSEAEPPNKNCARVPRALIVSDTRLLRDGLCSLLVPASICAVVGMVEAAEAPLAIRNGEPDLILLDAAVLSAPGLARRLREEGPSAKVIVFALAALDQDVIACAEIGIAGFVGRNGSAEDLLTAIEQTWRGQFAANHEVTAILVEGLAVACRARASGGGLTPRQRQIVPLLEQGLSNKEIARLLRVEVATVKNHVHSILGRMQLSRRGQLAFQRDSPRARAASVATGGEFH